MTLKITGNGFEEYGRYANLTIVQKTNEGTESIRIIQGEPEDMIFGRNLPMPNSFKTLLKQAYQAGKDGEDLKIEENIQ